ncbi:fibril biogenesis regulator DifG [Aggregicoccus sp. 17bor-14]|uniref:chemotaxis protein CheC n=1 Tax=Myxococcaceae TaxID=31 RepID=UPI00129C76AB|nr:MULTISPECIES: chemotaxis protein CheC [Myxococcaceae]MBF5041756.1 chemotaxis protein CheC [Simulacricoccus sp. 17bor-14]MRI87537.1 fibril biogenesis regulator DifG [Aggregicoccus sp. 17bor-14]
MTPSTPIPPGTPPGAELLEPQRDALREVANIGCGHAANALARLMGGRPVQLSVPRVESIDFSAGAADLTRMLGGAGVSVLGAQLGVEGELNGSLLMLLPTRDGEALGQLLMGGTPASAEDTRSALSETANILASACLSAIGTLTGWRLLPSVPHLTEGPAGDVVAEALSGMEGASARLVVLEARFSAPQVSGQLLLLLEPRASRELLQRLGVS